MYGPGIERGFSVVLDGHLQQFGRAGMHNGFAYCVVVVFALYINEFTDRSLSESGMKGEPKKARCPLRDNGYVKVLDSRSDQASRMNNLPVTQINRKPWRQSQICRQPYVSGGSWKTIIS